MRAGSIPAGTMTILVSLLVVTSMFSVSAFAGGLAEDRQSQTSPSLDAPSATAGGNNTTQRRESTRTLPDNHTSADQLVESVGSDFFLAQVNSSSFTGADVQHEIFTDARQGFPEDGDSYVVLSTGRAANAPGSADIFESRSVGGESIANGSPEGFDARDVGTLSATLAVPEGAEQLSFEYAFGTEENPTFLNSPFQDFFTATVVAPDGSTRNIATFPNGAPVTVDNANAFANSPGGSSFSPSPPLPSPNDVVYNSMTSRQTAVVDVSQYQGQTITLRLRVGDASDSLLDSAVFLDNVTFRPNDIDGDALLNDWEANGIDTDDDGDVDLNLSSMGADPLHKDVFVEVDYMEMHQPAPSAIRAVEESFADAPVPNPNGTSGIDLHVDVDDQIAHNNVLNFAGTGGQDFDDVKDANFDERRRLAFHYALFIHNQAPNDGTSGRAELPGNDLIVSLGEWPEHPRQQAGTFMHELGHNLGLRHGGFENTNFKPNYLSVMNYFYQTRGLVPIDNQQDGPDEELYDYSPLRSIDLDESGLDESVGVGDGPLRVFYFGPQGQRHAGFANQSIDWNRDGDLDNAAGVDLNDDGTRTTLEDHDDWANLQYNFRESPDFQDGVHETSPDPEDELDKETNDAIPDTVSVSIDIKPGSASNPVNPESSGVTPVAILSSERFDASNVTADSVRLAFSDDLAHDGHLEDVNDDGLEDLVLHFETESLVLAEGGDAATAVLDGRTVNGELILARGTVTIVGNDDRGRIPPNR